MKYIQSRQDLVDWLKVARVSQGFFFISAMPVLLGALLLWQHHDVLRPWLWLLMLGTALTFHLGADMINEYCDHISGGDALVDVKTPFSGGTRVLEEGRLAPLRVRNMAYIFFATGLLFAGVIAFFTRPEVMIFAGLGVLSCWGYSAAPLKLSHRGLGELVIGLNNGVFILGAMYAAEGLSAWGWPILPAEVWLPSAFLGLLGVAIITMNEVPDLRADEAIGKRNLVVRCGLSGAVWLHRGAVTLSALSLVAAVLLGHLPWSALAALAVFAWHLKGGLLRPISIEEALDAQRMSARCKATIKLKFQAWLVLMAASLLHWLAL